MAALPSGTVTFCFTDIEGSTQLFKRLGAGYEALLEDHRRLIREATAYHAGVEVKTDGDGCFLAFQHASAAAAAAAEIQRTVGSHPWPPNGEVRVRIGLHSGEAMPSGDDYVSLAVHQAARVGDAGHGGQVLVSADTAALIESGLPDEWGLVDLGEYRLRDFDESGHLYQLTGPGLERRFPPLRTPTAAVSRLVLQRAALVGREGELAELQRLLTRALAGHGALVLLGGEPGVGKTRLAEETAVEATRRGALTLTGRCYEAAGAVPYTPFVELLEETARVVAPALFREVLGDDAAQVAKIFPELRRLFDDIPAAIELPAEQERHYLFNSMRDYVERAARRRPLVLVLDDLHWADEATLSLFRHVAERLNEMAVLVVATYRDVELDVARPFADCLAELLRRRLAQRLALRRLAETDTAALIGALVRQQPPPALVEAIYSETEGNPFFVEEVVKYLAEEGRLLDADGHLRADVAIAELDVPEGVRLVVGRRLARLSETAREVLTAAAVVGRRFGFELVERLGQVGSDAVIDALEEAEMAHLILAEAGQYRFAHELIRQTLVAGLSLPRRQRLHLRVAEAMEQAYAGAIAERAADLGHHLVEAGTAADPAKTARYLMIAGTRALDSTAFEDALRHLEAALELSPIDATRERAQLLFAVGLARRSLGEWDDATESWHKALAIYEGLGDVEEAGKVCVSLAQELAWAGRFVDAAEIAGRGLVALGERESADRARLLGDLGLYLCLGSAYDAGDPLLAEAEMLNAKVDDRTVTASLAYLKTVRHWSAGDWQAAVDVGRHGAELLANATIPWDQANAMAFTVFALCEMGRWEEAAPLLQETQALAERLGNFGARLTCLRNRGWAGLARGDGPAEFERFAREDLELCRSTGWPWIMHAHLWLGAADFWQGRWDEAIDQLEDAVRTELPGVFAGQGWGALFLARARMGDRASAEAMLLDRPDVLEPPGPPPRSIGTWERLSATAEGLVLLGRAEEASAFYPALLEQLDHGTVLRGFDGRLVRAVAAMVAGAAGNWNEADSHYRATLELADRRPHPIEQAEVRRTWAEALLRREGPGDRSRAFELLGDAAQRYQELGMPRHREMTEAALVNFPPHLSGQPERRRHGSG